VVELLLENKTSINSRDLEGKTALHVASSSGKVEAVDLLLRNEADISTKDDKGNTALHAASIVSKV
jgi:ankyrin repeat protein